VHGFIRYSVLPAAMFLVGPAVAQYQPPQPPFYDRAIIEESGSEVVMRANGPRPLDQAVEGIRQQFGWQIDYEDPPYGPRELVDNTDPKWRADHPTAKGVTRVAGGVFTTTFNLASKSEAATSNEREAVLEKVVADYNQKGNPGRFVVKDEGRGRFSVVGIGLIEDDGRQRTINPILDAKIELPFGEYVLGDAIEQILRLVSQRTGQRIAPGFWPTNIVVQTKLKIGGEERSARELLSQAASSGRFPLVWRLLYDGDSGGYFLALDMSMR